MTADMKGLTLETLKEMVIYDHETGIFTHKRGYRKGLLASHFTTRGYKSVRVDKKIYKAHRVAWLYFYGVHPSMKIDHINGDPSDNRIANLRLATDSENSRNAKKRYDNKSGYKGVCWHKKTGKWMASIVVHGKSIYLGVFREREDAYLEYCHAAKKYHKDFANLGTVSAQVGEERISVPKEPAVRPRPVKSIPGYKSWSDMKYRCDSKGSSNYKDYGAKGISYCSTWSDFSAFIKDMGERPEGTFIGRKDHGKDFSKENCFWQPKKGAKRSKRKIA